MKETQCDYCLFLDSDQETGEVYCTINMDQDELEKVRMNQRMSCPYFRKGDDYSIVKKQGF